MLTLRIESASRWDALALARKLGHWHWFLVQPDLEHWDVYVSLENERCDSLPTELRQPLLEWLEERQLDATTIHAREAEIVVRRG